MTRQHILQEIKRLALANGGQAPGRDAFLKETSIKEWDWCKYWPRWNDAIREAGLTPNQMKQSYQEDYLLEKIVGLTRELGHFPVRNDYRVKAFSEKGFPNDKTFERFGSKSEVVAKVIQYCQKRGGFEDVIRMCEVALPKKKNEVPFDEDSEPTEKVGFVYLMKSGRFYKIGKSGSVGHREYQLGIQLPEKPSVIHTIRTDDPSGIEAYWHKRFEAKRKGGEWFDLSAADVKAFKRWIRIA